VIKEFEGVEVEDILKIELVPGIPNPEISHSPVINFIEVIREDITEKPEISEDVIILKPDETKKLLAQADEERNNKDFDMALEKYHTVLKGAPLKNDKMKALKGMEKIASTRSLLAIRKYCQKLNSIMWDYKEPDQELVDAAVRVYIAIARKLPEENKDRAIKMLNHSFSLTKNFTLRYLAISGLKDLGTTPGKEFEENNFVDHAGCGKKVKLTYPYSTSYTLSWDWHTYPAGGDMALTDGIKGTKDRDDGNWQGFLGDDLEAIIDLNEAITVKKISVNFLQNIRARIFLPTSVEFAISKDGKKFKVLATHENDISQKQGGAIIKEFIVALDNVQARYIQVKAKSIGVCPLWHAGAGRKVWLFCDEIQVY
ncbi:MAG: hypothetical protein GH151_01905, partial [Bacteroidetes bacterium]|nr:hypothetical protein [Bacteroidota bacterium]